MITYGFFNSLNGDRTYDANTFNAFFEGLVSPNGIFANVGDQFTVNASNEAGLKVDVSTGKAIVNSRWVKSDAVETLELETAHTLFDRYDMISLLWDNSTRTVSLEVTTGTPASTPVKPVPRQNKDIAYEIVLAYVRVKANATSVGQANITDTRHSTVLCGMVHVLVEQIDTSQIYNQYATAYQNILSDMEKWQKDQQTAFTEWLSTLTGQLQVNTYVERKQANYTVTDEKWYIQLPESLEYAPTDILDVYVNGVYEILGLDYTIQENEVEGGYMVKFNNSLQGTDVEQVITFMCTKSKIGVQ